MSPDQEPAASFADRVTSPTGKRPAVTTHTSPADGVPAEAWIFGLLIPLVGIIAGIKRLSQNQVGPGLALLLVGVLSIVGWIVVLAAASGA